VDPKLLQFLSEDSYSHLPPFVTGEQTCFNSLLAVQE
jgi:hypothetical protein